MTRYELPPDLTPEEERIVLAALERALAAGRSRPSPWALAGRAEALRMGALQFRRQTWNAWTFRGDTPFTSGGTRPLVGRGDTK